MPGVLGRPGRPALEMFGRPGRPAPDVLSRLEQPAPAVLAIGSARYESLVAEHRDHIAEGSVGGGQHRVAGLEGVVG